MNNANREKWLAARRAHITATDAAAIVGLHPYRSRFDVWSSKQGIVPETPDNEAMYWGREQEDVIARRYARDTGLTLVSHDYEVSIHNSLPWLGGTPDRTVLNAPHGLEIKTAGYRSLDRWGEAGEGVVPEEYVVQCSVYMSIFDYPTWDLAVLIAGQDYRVYNLRRDAELEAMVLEECGRFYTDHVKAGVPPAPDASPGCAAWLARTYPAARKPLLVANGVTEIVMGKLRDIRQAQATLADDAATCEAQIKAFIGEHEGVESAHGKITWRRNKDSEGTDWKAVAVALRGQVPRDVYEREVAANSYTKPGARVFRVPRGWTKTQDDTD